MWCSRSRSRRRSGSRASSSHWPGASAACSPCSTTGGGTATLSRSRIFWRAASSARSRTSNRTSIDTGRSFATGGGNGRGVGAGLWYDLGPHLVDQALQLFGVPDRVIGNLAAQRPGAEADDWAHVILEYGRRRVILHTSVVAAAAPPRFVVHGLAGSWIKYGLDRQERELIAALTPEGRETAHADERAVLVDGATGTEKEVPVPRGDYRVFYGQLRDALLGVGGNPVPPEQALAVIAVVEAAIESSAEGRAVTPASTST